MSARAINWAWTQLLKPLPKFVLVALADRADDEGICWPSVKWLMKKTGLPERSVREYCRVLRDTGLLATVPRRRDDGGQTSNEFRLAIPDEFGVAAPAAGGHEATAPPGGKASAPPPCESSAGQETSKRDVSLPDGKGTRSPKKFPIPDGYSPSGEVMKWAEGHGLLASYVGQQLEAFRDDALSNRRIHAHWDAAFRQWLRNQHRFDKSAPRPVKGAPGASHPVDRRCVWPRLDALDRCIVTEGEDKEGSWLGRGAWICSRHLKDHLDRADVRAARAEARP